MDRCVHRFDATALGSQGSCLLSAVAFLLRRRGVPPAARPPLDRVVADLLPAVLSLRSAVALRVLHFASLFPGSGLDLWATAASQLGSAALEAGCAPLDLPSYLDALRREGRCLDTLQLVALADVLSAHLQLFVPFRPTNLGDGWLLHWVVAPRDTALVPLAHACPPLCVGLACGRAWALEPGVEASDAWGPGHLDAPLVLLRGLGALLSISSPSPSSLSLLVADQERFTPSSSDSDDFHFHARGPGAGLSGELDDPDSRRSPSPPSPPSGSDLDEAEHVESLLALEAEEVRRHLLLRSHFGDLLRAASAAFLVLGRLP